MDLTTVCTVQGNISISRLHTLIWLADSGQALRDSLCCWEADTESLVGWLEAMKLDIERERECLTTTECISICDLSILETVVHHDIQLQV